ncbi:MAG: hypothetical protein OXU62_03100 [Gammaproteobacteria bacterium]|nr:hypothetical protein [Gammaproteobacteria bacterium]
MRKSSVLRWVDVDARIVAQNGGGDGGVAARRWRPRAVKPSRAGRAGGG